MKKRLFSLQKKPVKKTLFFTKETCAKEIKTKGGYEK
jgi:hypothetical protein